ncbi:MAG: DNA-processing protein DprA [Solirubrobacteraceae bacterium]
MSAPDPTPSAGDAGDAGDACDACLRRPWLLGELASHLERTGGRLQELLELEDADLLQAVAGRRRARLERRMAGFDPEAARVRAQKAGVQMICRCAPEYPRRLADLPNPPKVLHVAGDVDLCLAGLQGLGPGGLTSEPVAVVGTRRPTSYGLDVARALGRDLAAAGITVVSGMAQGIDSVAHDGALSAGGPTIAILAGSAERPYPPSRRSLHRRITSKGAAVSELPPGSGLWRWMFPARNRLIAALAVMTIVVEAGERSGALLTAATAASIGRPVGAVPGRITTAQGAGPNGLLAEGAHLITSAQDVLDVLYGVGVRSAARDRAAELDPQLRPWLEAISAGHDTPAALARVGLPADKGLQVLSALELSGYIRREPGGRFAVMP